jgi:hypothetical protein
MKQLSLIFSIISICQHLSNNIEDYEPSLHSTIGNVQFLWAAPIERIQLFPSPTQPEFPALLPESVRIGLNELGIEFYKIYKNSTFYKNLRIDSRDAESVLNGFREFQHQNSNEIRDSINSKFHKQFEIYFEISNLLSKITTDFVTRMGFGGGTKYLYSTRLFAEVLAPGDAVAPRSHLSNGAVAGGVIFTHLPHGTLGNAFYELIDPRGANPPFGDDKKIPVTVGTGYIYPAWVSRMTPSHRHPGPETADIMDTHRIDWSFEIGLFTFDKRVREKFVDWEKCPFKDFSFLLNNQLNFEINLESILSIQPPDEPDLDIINVLEKVQQITQ